MPGRMAISVGPRESDLCYIHRHHRHSWFRGRTEVRIEKKGILTLAIAMLLKTLSAHQQLTLTFSNPCSYIAARTVLRNVWNAQK